MLKNAPHITLTRKFVIPVYTFWDVFMYTVGLKFYDLLAGRLSMGIPILSIRKNPVEITTAKIRRTERRCCLSRRAI